MPDDLGRMPLSPEVDPFQAEVGRDQRFVPGWNLQNGTVISNPGYDSGDGPLPATDAGNQRLFVQGQAGSIY